jgi:transcription initiation factor TFIIH subunit 3
MLPSKKASSSSSTASSNTLLVIVLDVSPLVWGERDVKRTALDRARAAKGQAGTTRGPALLEEVLDAVQAFANAVTCLERDCALIISVVADNETAVVHPRKNHLAQWLAHPASYTPDIRRLKQDLLSGVAELIARTVEKQSQESTTPPDPANRQASMAAAFSTALCIMNRLFLAARDGGVSALHSQHYLERVDDQGVVALGSTTKKIGRTRASAWAPRILLIQASQDRARDYNAFMNCAFAANKNQIVVDGCFIPDLPENGSSTVTSSAFLEQVCDLTSGVFLLPSGMSQIGGALTESLLSVLLAPLRSRAFLNLPAHNKVDFRARCFETGDSVDMAYVCSQCLSIFRHKPGTGLCPTCQATILERNLL